MGAFVNSSRPLRVPAAWFAASIATVWRAGGEAPAHPPAAAGGKWRRVGGARLMLALAAQAKVHGTAHPRVAARVTQVLTTGPARVAQHKGEAEAENKDTNWTRRGNANDGRHNHEQHSKRNLEQPEGLAPDEDVEISRAFHDTAPIRA